jgi:hypothetical protein
MIRDASSGRPGASLTPPLAANMLIRLDDRALIDDLCAHFRRSVFQAEPEGSAAVRVHQVNAVSTSEERQQILLHLRVWQVINPGARISGVD